MTSPHPTAGRPPVADTPSPLPTPTPRWTVDYTDADLDALLARDDTLAVFGFGADAPRHGDPRYLRVSLQPHGAAPLEVWRVAGPVSHGRDGGIAWSEDGALQFGAIELDEPPGEEDSDIERTAEAIYRRLPAFLAARGYPHLLRMWNYLDGITSGHGDDERYRRFCVGRARALGTVDPGTLPAATAIGRVDGERRMQVYWLAARTPGTPLENPRQVSAWRYPRQYGPQPPGFARAMLPPDGSAMPLMLSGTAAIVGHESQHRDSVEAQLDEVLVNLDHLVDRARQQRPELPETFGPGTRLKVYVRDAAELPHVAQALATRLPPSVSRIVLHGAVCRRELRVEIDGVHGH
ncbi:chorismate lyase/3-hydroxybenzoate synthase [Lysobacter ruishenii]|uniref:Chorismate lyase/3-hydroxybenzoate synthase n=1 Tax=Aerolutibacter ruishenii TaxID=686800 RepID=A0A562M0L6_9GAMM|nr:pteridine-dependent deoxygenase [Lysobacter ruishenii]TWI13328.1 chorismate lyase/3-hydroxybenzoate synthase [Lysobacter ruishenii]